MSPLPSPQNSTNVRVHIHETAAGASADRGATPPPREKPLPWRAAAAGLHALSHAAPKLAARVAYEMFRTPPRYRTRDGEAESLWMADDFTVRLGGRKIRGWAWGDGPNVLLVHGWGGRASQLTAFVTPLLRAGFRVLTFDAPGHGASEGSRSSLPEVAAAIERVVRQEGPLAGLIAHSMGAAASVLAFERMRVPERLVFLAPPSRARHATERFAAALELTPEVRASLEAALERRFLRPIDELDVTRAPSAHRAPLLVIHDETDREVPLSDGLEIVAAWPGSALVRTRGLGHVRLLRDPAVAATAAAFVEGTWGG